MNSYEQIQKICTDLVEACFTGTTPVAGDIIDWARGNKKKKLAQQLHTQTEIAWTTAVDKACALIRTGSKVPENLAMTQQMTKATVIQMGGNALVAYCNTLVARKQEFDTAAQQLEEYKNGIREAGMDDWMTGANQNRMLVAGYGNNNYALIGSIFAGLRATKNTGIRQANYMQGKADLAAHIDEIEHNEIYEVIAMLKLMPIEFADMLISMTEGTAVDVNQRNACQEAIAGFVKRRTDELETFLTRVEAERAKLQQEAEARRQAEIQDEIARKARSKRRWGIGFLLIGTLLAFLTTIDTTIMFAFPAAFFLGRGLTRIPRQLNGGVKYAVFFTSAIAVIVAAVFYGSYQEEKMAAANKARQRASAPNSQPGVSFASAINFNHPANQTAPVPPKAAQPTAAVTSAPQKAPASTVNPYGGMPVVESTKAALAAQTVVPSAADYEQKVKAGLAAATQNTGLQKSFFDLYSWMVIDHALNPNASEIISDVMARQPTLNDLLQKLKSRVPAQEWAQCCNLVNQSISDRIKAAKSAPAFR